jgi:hypothetical protein
VAENCLRPKYGRKPGDRRTVALHPQVSAPATADTPPFPTGVAVDAQGNVYVSTDLNNAIHKVRPQR